MVNRIVRTVAATAVVLLIASAAVFALVRSAPGDPADVQLGESGGVALSQADEDRIRAERLVELGLDRPLPEQYARWLSRMASGDWGTSYRSGRPVLVEIADRVPASLVLGITGFAVSVLLAGALAVVASRRPGGPTDQSVRLLTLLTVAVPSFLLGTIALQVATGTVGYRIAGPGSLDRLWLPALVLGIASTPTMSRVLRASLVAERAGSTRSRPRPAARPRGGR